MITHNKSLGCLAVLIVLALATSALGQEAQDDAARRARVMEMYGLATQGYPDLGRVTLEQAMALSEKGEIRFIDVRSPEEQAVSMLPGAVPVQTFLDTVDEMLDKPLVAYCTIGQRSSNFAMQLKRYGLEVANLEGSLLGWIHAGGEVLDPEGVPTLRVHAAGQYAGLVPVGYEAVW